MHVYTVGVRGRRVPGAVVVVRGPVRADGRAPRHAQTPAARRPQRRGQYGRKPLYI